MRRRPAFLAALLVLCTVAIAHLPGNADGDMPGEDLLVVAYTVDDLPVWTTKRILGLKFLVCDPKILSRLIELSVDPESWGSHCGSINVDESGKQLIIRQTQTNHDRIAALLGQLRSENAKGSDSRQSSRRTDTRVMSSHQQVVDPLEGLRTADQRKQAQAKGSVTKLTLTQPKTVMPPDPLMEQLKAMPYNQRLHIPIDMKVLARPPIR